jgi:hypothetical protein
MPLGIGWQACSEGEPQKNSQQGLTCHLQETSQTPIWLAIRWMTRALAAVIDKRLYAGQMRVAA